MQHCAQRRRAQLWHRRPAALLAMSLITGSSTSQFRVRLGIQDSQGQKYVNFAEHVIVEAGLMASAAAYNAVGLSIHALVRSTNAI